jgi:hypothetical protein
MDDMSDDGVTRHPGGPSAVASIAAKRLERSRAGLALAGAMPSEPEDLVGLQAVVVADPSADTLAAAPDIPAQPDGSDILRRLERATESNGIIGRLGEVMARITADDPATAAFWASLTRQE